MFTVSKKVMAAAGTAVAFAQLTAGTVMAQPSVIGTVDPGRGFAGNIGGVISSVLSFVMVIAALLVLMYLVWGGIEWISSGGDKSKTEGARNKITAAIIGIIILAAAYAIFNLVLWVLGFSSIGDVFTNIRRISG